MVFFFFISSLVLVLVVVLFNFSNFFVFCLEGDTTANAVCCFCFCLFVRLCFERRLSSLSFES